MISCINRTLTSPSEVNNGCACNHFLSLIHLHLHVTVEKLVTQKGKNI